MEGEIVGAIVGASAAVVTQIVATFAQHFSQKRSNEISEKQLALTAEARFIELKLEALVGIRDTLQELSDHDIDARSAYQRIRPKLIFLDTNLEGIIFDAVRESLPQTPRDRAETTVDRDSSLKRALDELRSQSVLIWSKYHVK